MLFWITVIIMLFSAMLFIIAMEVLDSDVVSIASGVVSLLSAAVAITMVFVIIFNNVGINGTVAELHQQYDSLVYQAENHMYDDVFKVGKKELADQITRWNKDLARKQANQKDNWLGIFVPNIYDEFEFIPIELLGN